MNTVNLCKAIDCHFCDNKNGCRLFLVSGHCPLSLQSDVDNNQYWLFINNPSPARLNELKEIHTKEVESLDTFKNRKEWEDNELQDLAWNYPD